jgi:hypothetical protein
MTEICLLGAKTIVDLKSLHNNLLRLFNSQQANFLRNEISMAEQFSGNSWSGFFIQTAAPITKFNRAKGLHFSDQASKFFAHEFQNAGLFFAILTIKNRESDLDAILRFFNEAPQVSLLENLEDLSIKIDIMYC